jgi:hypothetical protein
MAKVIALNGSRLTAFIRRLRETAAAFARWATALEKLQDAPRDDEQ